MPRNRVIQPGTQIKFMCGDVVAREDDPAHEGKVVAVFDNCARVLWENRTKEDVDQDELVLISRKRRSGGGPTIRPATVVESPRARLERLLREDQDQ